ncbi:MAG: baseplate protein J [Spirulina sp.]
MTLPLPNLDDRSYADLVEEAISRIPVEYPEWTDHNPSDTGIILIELLAWLTEMTLYRVNQIPDKNYEAFLSLLKVEHESSSGEAQKSLPSQIQDTLSRLRDRYRAVTPEDYEKLVLEDWHKSKDFQGSKIARVKCLPQWNLDPSATDRIATGHISLVVVPEEGDREEKDKYKDLLHFLDQRKLLTTRLHIVEPEYVCVALETDLVLEDGALAEDVQKKAREEVTMFFDPLKSEKYWQGQGWPFGRGIYLSELYKLLDDLEGVDYVESLLVKDKDKTHKPQINLAENQLVKFDPINSKLTILVEVGNERKTI